VFSRQGRQSDEVTDTKDSRQQGSGLSEKAAGKSSELQARLAAQYPYQRPTCQHFTKICLLNLISGGSL
jgi:hypothetical protein